MHINRGIYWTLLFVVLLVAGCVDDDNGEAELQDLPLLRVSDLIVEEADVDKVFSVEITLDRPNNETNVVADLGFIDGTAKREIDFAATLEGRLVFAPGETSKMVDFTILADELLEPDEEFELLAYNIINANVEKDRATVRISDDDSELVPGLDLPTDGYDSPNSYEGYTLVWSDEFNGDTLNDENWTHDIGTGCPDLCGWGNSEKQYYRTENTSLVNGNLVIGAKRESFASSDYTSSRILSKGKQEFQYGRIDIRAALPVGQGLWPALWMLGTNIDEETWPRCGEIDIVEARGDEPYQVYGTAHWGDSFDERQNAGSTASLDVGAFIHEEYHVYSLDWSENQFQILVDDEIYFTANQSTVQGQNYPFNQPFYFVFNVSVGGTFSGDPDEGTAFPQYMAVDYVRVFQEN